MNNGDERRRKYSAPVPLFSQQIVMRTLSEAQKKPCCGPYSLHPIHDLICNAMRDESHAHVALSYIPQVVKSYSRSNTTNLARVADYIFILAVFDPTTDKPGWIRRDLLVEAIEDIVRADPNYFQNGPRPRLQGVVSVLQNYGAVFEDSEDLRQTSVMQANGASLDEQAERIFAGHGKEPNPVSEEFDRSERNLGRLFSIASAQVRQGVPLGYVMFEKIIRDPHEAVLRTLGICTRVLLSAFGNRLCFKVRELIKTSLLLIDEADWPDFRIKAASYIHSFTTRLALHVELVVYLLPSDQLRSKDLSADIAYLSLKQWAASNSPVTVTLNPTERARVLGTEKISFCLSDVVSEMKAIPDVTDNTDLVWLSLLARILKFVLTGASLLDRGEKEQVGVARVQFGRLRTSFTGSRIDNIIETSIYWMENYMELS